MGNRRAAFGADGDFPGPAFYVGVRESCKFRARRFGRKQSREYSRLGGQTLARPIRGYSSASSRHRQNGAASGSIDGNVYSRRREESRPKLRICGAVPVIMSTMSEVAESAAVPDGLVRRIAERFSPDKIIVFGSCARGEMGPDSDIDLLVLFADVADPHKRAAELYASLADFPHPMDIIVSTTSRFERFRNVVNTVYWPASREGKVLYERAA